MLVLSMAKKPAETVVPLTESEFSDAFEQRYSESTFVFMTLCELCACPVFLLSNACVYAIFVICL